MSQPSQNSENTTPAASGTPETGQSHPTAHAILEDPEFIAFASRRTRVSLLLTLVTMAGFFGFVFLLAFAPEKLAVPTMGTTVGIPMGIGVIILCWITTGIYVNWANNSYDRDVEHLKGKL